MISFIKEKYIIKILANLIYLNNKTSIKKNRE